MIRTQMGKRNRSEMVTVQGTLCMTSPRNSNQYLFMYVTCLSYPILFDLIVLRILGEDDK
jgi:hypothetical protein